uniref:Uncharacterized protein n=1 Tax=Alexandrium monilatum TaxID=311494 RepID=A0A7S4QWP5_9DINO|mmetsp:Transcript_104421/g.332244  ORF Transcript_104421/g.332244 Transcript_104421/m.332244 type:complete len:248 (+) Transcript_104421:69-812(+)
MASTAPAWAARAAEPTLAADPEDPDSEISSEEMDEEVCNLCDGQGTPFGCCVGCSEGWVCDGKVSLRYGDNGAEKFTAELEQRAVVEAEGLVSSDGAVCQERLAFLRAAFDPSFVQRVLARLPYAALAELPAAETDADALNTSLLLEDFREIRQWQGAAPTVRTIFPPRLLSIFEQTTPFDARRLVPEGFVRAHPTLAPPSRARGGKMANLAEYQSLLRAFCSGIIEGLPLNPDQLIVGGSVMPSRC